MGHCSLAPRTGADNRRSDPSLSLLADASSTRFVLARLRRRSLGCLMGRPDRRARPLLFDELDLYRDLRSTRGTRRPVGLEFSVELRAVLRCRHGGATRVIA